MKLSLFIFVFALCVKRELQQEVFHLYNNFLFLKYTVMCLEHINFVFFNLKHTFSSLCLSFKFVYV